LLVAVMVMTAIVMALWWLKSSRKWVWMDKIGGVVAKTMRDC
jgi:hypothetical protein